MMKIALLLFLLSFCCSAQKKVALVIGAQSYSTLQTLRHSLNDARAMSKSLADKGFDVESLYDPKTKKDIKDAITRYYNKMRDETGAVGVIFYAGHGMQFEGDNYIIPTQATLDNPGDLEDQCVKMNTVMAVLKAASKSLNILLLDACRKVPSFTRDTEMGLTRMEAPQGSILVFAAQAGKLASDGEGANGLFTAKLLEAMEVPNMNITDVFKRVKSDVYAASGQNQLPSVEDNSIGGDFFFNKTATSPGPNAPGSTGQGTVKFVADMDAVLFIDGENKGKLSIDIPLRVTLAKGDYLLKAVSVANPNDFVRWTYSVNDIGYEKLESVSLANAASARIASELSTDSPRVNSTGPKIKYKDLYIVWAAKQYETAEPFLRKYLDQYQDNPHAYLAMGTLLYNKWFLAAPEKKAGIKDEALKFYRLARKTITKKSIDENSRYYEAFNRRDLRTGKFVIQLSDVQFEIDSQVSKLDAAK